MMLTPTPHESSLSKAANSTLAKMRAARRPRSKSFLFLVHFSEDREILCFKPSYQYPIWSDSISEVESSVQKITSTQSSSTYRAVYVTKIGLLASEEPSTCKYLCQREKGKIGTEYGLSIKLLSKHYKRINIRYDTGNKCYELDT